jgi:hypothetical protein
MTKLLLMILGAAAAGLLLRRALTRAGIVKPRKGAAGDGAMARLKRELDLLLWIPPILLGLGALYVGATLIHGALTR